MIPNIINRSQDILFVIQYPINELFEGICQVVSPCRMDYFLDIRDSEEVCIALSIGILEGGKTICAEQQGGDEEDEEQSAAQAFVETSNQKKWSRKMIYILNFMFR